MTATTEQTQPENGNGTAGAPPSADPSAEQQLELASTKSNAAALIKFGAMPETLHGAWIMASVYAKSPMVPKDYIGKPHNIMIAWDLGLSLGFTPMQCLQSIAVIGNRPGVWGDGFLAVCLSSPSYKDHDEYYLVGGERREIIHGLHAEELKEPDTKAVCVFTVAGRERPVGGSFSIGQAQRAGLLGKDSPWRTYPERMLLMRARGFAGRDAFPGQLRGIKTAEELRDIPPDIDVTAQPVPEPVRRSEKALAAPEPEQQTASEVQAETLLGATELPESKPKAEPTAKPKSAGKGATAAVTTGKPAISKPTPEAATDSTPGVIVSTPHLAFTESALVQPKGDDAFYELRAVVQKQGEAPVGYVFRTREQDLYKLAESCEGTNKTFTVRWHQATTKDGGKCKAIDAIEAGD
jgi:hypothetical protein